MKSTLQKKWVQSGIGLFISLSLIVWLLYSIDWKQVWLELLQVHYVVLIPSIIAFTANMLFRAMRWHHFLPAKERVPLTVRFDALMLGALASFVLPLRAGEFVRPLLLAKRSEHSFSAAFASVVVERFFDLSAVLLSFGVLLLCLPEVPVWAHHGAFLLSIMAVGILVFMVVGIFLPVRVKQLCELCLRPAPKRLRAGITAFLNDLLAAAAVLRNLKNLLTVLAYTGLVWFAAFLLNYVFFFGFSIEPSPLLAVSVGVIVALAIAAPSAPGFIGVYQTGCIGAFALFGISQETAIAFSLVTHALQYVLIVGYGVLVLLKYNISMKELTAKTEN